MNACNEVFSDSDSEYIQVNASSPPLKKRLKKSALASPKVAKRISKSDSSMTRKNCDGLQYETIQILHSPVKSPRNLRQLLPKKSPGKTDHVPLTNERKSDPNHLPYYLINFECILRGVIDESDDCELFNDEELKIVEQFRQLDLNCKKLYVRLFQRKNAWIARNSIKYEEIPDLDRCLEVLKVNSFLKSGEDINDLEILLKLLSAPEVKQLCKNMNIKAKGSQKTDHCNALIAHSKKKSFFTTKSNLSDIIAKKARDMMKGCQSYFVEESARCVFLRILSLYSLSNWWDERESDKNTAAAPQLTTILLQNTGRLVFPIFKITRQSKIFAKRDDLLSFEAACALESTVAEAMGEKAWSEASKKIEEANHWFQATLENEEIRATIKAMPVFLRKFTTGSVLAYILTKGVEVYERMRNYDQAVCTLRKLIAQDLYLPDYHGFWYERLALDLDQHLKTPLEALKAIKEAMNDEFVQEARLLSLCQRVTKISLFKKKTLMTDREKKTFEDHNRWLAPPEPPKITIPGKMMPKANLPGEKSLFIFEGKSENENDLICSVEEYVKHYFKAERGYTNGLHAEGSVVNTITAIIFWDILYDIDVPDAFRSPIQSVPLDYDTSSFYDKRKNAIEQRLADLIKWSPDELCGFVSERWDACSSVSASPANWELFSSLNHLLSLLKCFTGEQLSSLCRRLVMNHRHTRSGFPDLTMWSTQSGRVTFVEVKGPNDRLSNKQILWLEYLTANGIEALVCHVDEVNGGKYLSPKKKRAIAASPQKRKRKSSADDFI